MDVAPHAVAVEVGDLEVLGFLELQPAGVDGGEEGVVVGGAYTDDKARKVAEALSTMETDLRNELKDVKTELKIGLWMLGLIITINIGLVLMMVRMFSSP